MAAVPYRQELEVLCIELNEFYKTQAEISKTREQIGVDRVALEVFLKSVEEFRRHIFELDSRMNAITSKLSVVDHVAESMTVSTRRCRARRPC